MGKADICTWGLHANVRVRALCRPSPLYRAYAPYQQLEYVSESPKLPYGYFGTVVMVLFADRLFQAYAAGELRRHGLGPFAVPASAGRPAAVA